MILHAATKRRESTTTDCQDRLPKSIVQTIFGCELENCTVTPEPNATSSWTESEVEEEHIYCIEGHWEHAPCVNSLVEGMLSTNLANGGMPYTRRNCATLDEMHFWLASEWAELPSGSVLYVASHGAPGRIKLSKSCDGFRPQVGAISTLPDSALAGERFADGCLVHFGGCNVVDIRDEDLDGFMKRSGAVAVSGFTEEVGFLDYRDAGLSLEGQFFNSIGPYADPECRLDLLSGNSRRARDRRQHLRNLEQRLQEAHPECGFRLRLSPKVRACDH